MSVVAALVSAQSARNAVASLSSRYGTDTARQDRLTAALAVYSS